MNYYHFSVSLMEINRALQKIAEYVIRELANQGCAAKIFTGSCRYRGPNETKCAAGMMIPDSIAEQMEGESITFIADHPLLFTQFKTHLMDLGYYQIHPVAVIAFLQRLQFAHDFDGTWKNRETFINNFGHVLQTAGLSTVFMDDLHFGGRLGEQK